MTAMKEKARNMLERLIDESLSGKKVYLKSRPIRELVRLERENRQVDTVVLSMEYSGSTDGESFRFVKQYSFAEDDPQYAVACLLIANNRLQMDYERLNGAGIETVDVFFTFQNCFLGQPTDTSLKRPVLRLQDFIYLSRAGIPVSVTVNLTRPSMILKQEGTEKKGFGCMATFAFTTAAGTTTVEKLYGLGPYDDAKGDEEDIVEVANRRLERDCSRLRKAGLTVEEDLSFLRIYEKVFSR
jgi:hypothetical protein